MSARKLNYAIDGGQLTADQVVGKILWAKSAIEEHKLPDRKSEILGITQPGQSIGMVYSWVQRDNIWWMMEYSDGTYFYIEHLPGIFDWEKLLAQFDENPIPTKKISDVLVVSAILFGGYMVVTAKTSGQKYLWGGISAIASGYLLIEKVKNIKINLF
jgi:hypothetical protein